MSEPTEQEVLERAYQIWERNNKPEGREDEFWQAALRELRNEDKSNPLRPPQSGKILYQALALWTAPSPTHRAIMMAAASQGYGYLFHAA